MGRVPGYSEERNQDVLYLRNKHEGRWKTENITCTLDLK